jgi:regulator of RNase E activity RraA
MITVTSPLAELIGPAVTLRVTESDAWAIYWALCQVGEDDLADAIRAALSYGRES